MKQNRIPTILAIFIITVSLIATVLLFNNIRGLLGQASQNLTPNEIKITNITSNGFSVSWITAQAATGTISYGESESLGKIASDDRDQISGKTDKYLVHHVTLRFLKPNSKYFYKIVSDGQVFDNNGQVYIVTTAPDIGLASGDNRPIYGTILSLEGKPAEGVIVYLNINQVTPMSTLTKSTGTWLLTLNNARTTDLAKYANFSGNEKINLFIQDGKEITQATVNLSQESPVPTITLGKNNNSNNSETVSSQTGQQTNFKSTVSGFNNSLSPSLISPASQSAIPADRPLFTGTGVPGTSVEIKVESTNPISATTTVNQNGSWSWTPPNGLTPGEHTVTISTTDNEGKLVKFMRSFTVLAAGTSITEPATPSASPKTSPTPTPILTPTPKATASTAPASGDLTPTFFLILTGLSFISLGFGRILWQKNN